MANDIARTEVDNYLEKNLTAEEKDYVSSHNEELLREFYQSIKGGRGRTKKREKWYLGKWKQLLKRYIDSEEDGIQTEKLDELTRLEYAQILDNLKEDKEKDYADNTVDDFKSAIRMFYKSRYMEFQRPDRVKEILQAPVMRDQKESEKEKKRVRNILTPQQVRKMCKAAENPRDSLLPIFLFDCGARTEEVEELSVGSVNRRTSPWEVTFHDAKNNKDDRDLPMVHCQEKLRNWIENHPDSDNPNAPLWVVLTNSGQAEKGTKMSQENINDRLKHLADEANLKDIDPDTVTVYDFRHSSATFRGTELGLGIQQMMWWFAWLKPSRAKTYCKDDNERMKNAIKERHGFDVEEDDQETSLDTKWCGRCESERSADAQYCPVCSLPLDSETAIKDSELREAGKRVVEMKLDGKVEDEKLSEIVNGLAESR
jgi:site-specific recombinase XerD